MSSKQQQSKRDKSETYNDGVTNKKAKIVRDSSNETLSDNGRSSEDNKNRIQNKNDESKILLNNKLVDRPSYPTSYGILFYREQLIEDVVENKNNTNRKTRRRKHFEYLLGLIPQRNSLTMFKGLPEGNERPRATAIREFEEESSLTFPYKKNNINNNNNREKEEEDYDFDWDNKYEILYGVTSTKKLLQIYLLPAPSDLDISKFDIDKVMKIDNGFWAGKPEIVQLFFLTKNQAIKGTSTSTGNNNNGKTTKVARIYKSQISILERAETILNEK